MKVILIDVVHEFTKEYICTEIFPLLSPSKTHADIFTLRDRGMHIPTLIRAGRCEFRDNTEPNVLKTANLSRDKSFVVTNLEGNC